MGNLEKLHERTLEEFAFDKSGAVTVQGLGFGVWGLGFGAWDLGFGVFQHLMREERSPKRKT